MTLTSEHKGTQANHEQPQLDDQLRFRMERIPVIFYDDSLRDDLLDACEQYRHIGLTHIRHGVPRDILFCFTTPSAIYVLDTKKDSLDMIRYLLSTDQGIKFYTTRGQIIMSRLSTEFGIKAAPKSMIDLPALDAAISMRKCSLNGCLGGKYTISRLSDNQDMVRYNDRVDLTWIYLAIRLEQRNREQEKLETEMIIEDPTSVDAVNVIRKRSCLIDLLGIKMQESFEAMTFQDSNNLYSFAFKVRDESYIEYENLDDNSYSTVIDYLKKQGCDHRP